MIGFCSTNCVHLLKNIKLQFYYCDTDQVPLNALLEVLGSVPHYITKSYEKELPWLRSMLTSTKQDVRQVAAKTYSVITGYFPRNEFEKHLSSVMEIMSRKQLEAQHGALITLTYMMERSLIRHRSESKEDLRNWTTYNEIVKTICMHSYIRLQTHFVYFSFLYLCQCLSYLQARIFAIIRYC